MCCGRQWCLNVRNIEHKKELQKLTIQHKITYVRWLLLNMFNLTLNIFRMCMIHFPNNPHVHVGCIGDIPRMNTIRMYIIEIYGHLLMLFGYHASSKNMTWNLSQLIALATLKTATTVTSMLVLLSPRLWPRWPLIFKNLSYVSIAIPTFQINKYPSMMV